MKKLIFSLLFLCSVTLAPPPPPDFDDDIHGIGHEISDNFYEFDEPTVIYETMEQNLSDETKAERYASKFRNNFPKYTYMALENLFHTAYVALLAKHQYQTAIEVRDGWHREKFHLRMFLTNSRNIGDFNPLSKWLADIYNKIEGAIGKQLCDLLRISDIKTFNYCIPVVFKPCGPPWGKEDFIDHFATDGNYHGLSPVVLHWVTYTVCAGVTWGTGIFTVCSPIARTLEYLYQKLFSEKLGSSLYDKLCRGAL